MSPKTVLITGCSAGGIGDALAQSFHRKGYEVFATARDLSKVKHLQELGIKVLALDVTSETSLSACVKSVASVTGGRLDILINNAGIEYSMPLLDIELPEARKVFETNFFGVLATSQSFSDMLIAAKGRIVNIGSVAQFVPVPWLGIYNSSKAAAAMLSDTLRLELAPFGVKVIHIVTGGVVSHIHDNQTRIKLPPKSLYALAKEPIEEILSGSVSKQSMMDARQYAEKVVAAVSKEKPSARLYIGNNSTLMWVIFTFGWHVIWDLLFPGMYALSTLAKAVRAKEDKRA